MTRTLSIITFSLLLTTGVHAEVLDWPMGNTDAFGTWVPGHGAYIQQTYENTTHKGHPGEPHEGIDLQLRDPATGDVSAAYTVGKDVRAAAGGFVSYSNPKANWPGGVLMLRHRDRHGNNFYTLYAHLAGMTTVPVGTWVNRGALLGTVIYQQFQGTNNSHLHFEVRDARQPEPGDGYGSPGSDLDSIGWIDPVSYYYTHRRACAGEGLHFTAPQENLPIRSAPSTSAVLLETLQRGTRVLVEDVVPDLSEGARTWWFKVAYQRNNEVRHGFAGASAHLNYDALINLVQPRRACELVVPGFYNGQFRPWDTNLYIRNNGPISQNVHVEIYRPGSSSSTYSQIFNIAPDARRKVSIGDDIVNGTAVIRASNVWEGTEDLSVVARHHVSNPTWVDGDTFSSWEAVRRGASRQVVPVVHRDNFRWDNTITIFNPSTSPREIDLDFTGVSGCDRTDYTLSGRRTLVIDTESWTSPSGAPCFYDGYVGALEIVATDTTGNPQPVMVASRQENRLGGGAYESMATVGLGASGSKLYLPLIQNKNYHYRAGIGAGRITGGGTLDVDFRRNNNGLSCLTDNFSGWPVIETPFPENAPSTCTNVLSAHLELTAPGQMFVQFNQLFDPEDIDPKDPNSPEPNHDSSSSTAEAHPNTRAYLPYFDEQALLHGIQIQNTEGETTNATVYFFDANGNPINGNPSATVSIAAFGTVTLVHEIPSTTRSARVEAGTKVAVLVNNVMDTGLQDDLMDYVAPTGVD